MNVSDRPLLILVAGPYRSQTNDDPEKIAANLRGMNTASLAVFRRGHVPVTGEALALPLVEVAGSRHIGDAIFNEIFHPIARRLIPSVDGVWRIGGTSAGADEMVALAEKFGKKIYRSLDEIPAAPASTHRDLARP